jgi:hypothetical protein
MGRVVIMVAPCAEFGAGGGDVIIVIRVGGELR